jgi:tRNA isopentenyl-2-thiomethyl-A-37 hydroxylase MiaE
MSFDPERITYFAETDFRSKKAPFGIKAKDRTKHVYVIGKTGMGKSTMLENMAVQDIKNGEGFAFVDPHGGTAEKLLEYVPPERLKDVLYFAPFDMDYPISFNVMEDVGADKRHLVANGLMSAFKKIWVDAWSARMEYILNNTILALLEYPGSTLISINRMFADKGYREEVVSNVTDTAVKAFWTQEFANYTDRFASEATPAIQNKVGQFVSNPLIRNIIGQSRSSFDLREMMDHRKIIIVNLSKGRMGEDNANLLGSMLITKIYLAAMSRADMNAESLERLPNFYLYVDEFQSFANESFANILSEARKYKLNLTLAHQYIEQMSEEVRAAVFGNVGTMISFRVGAFDAEILEKEFAPEFTAEDMVNLGFTQIYLKLMIDGVSSSPFSATTMPPLPLPRESYIRNIVEESRRQFAQPRDEVEDRIRAWHEKHFSPGVQSFAGGQGGRSGGGGGGGKKKKKKGGPSPEDRERALREAISSAKDDDDELPLAEQIRRRRDDKGPSDEKLKELEKTISQSSPKDNSREAPGAKGNDESEGGDDNFVPLQDLAKKLGSAVNEQTAPSSQAEKSTSEERLKNDPALSSLRNLMEGMVGSSAHADEVKSGNNSSQGKQEISPDKLKEILRGDDRN